MLLRTLCGFDSVNDEGGRTIVPADVRIWEAEGILKMVGCEAKTPYDPSTVHITRSSWLML